MTVKLLQNDEDFSPTIYAGIKHISYAANGNENFLASDFRERWKLLLVAARVTKRDLWERVKVNCQKILNITM